MIVPGLHIGLLALGREQVAREHRIRKEIPPANPQPLRAQNLLSDFR